MTDNNSFNFNGPMKELSLEERQQYLFPSIEETKDVIGGYTPEQIQQRKQNWEELEQQGIKNREENLRRSQLTGAERAMEDFNEAYQRGVEIDTEAALRNNPKYNQAHVKELLHNYTKIDSTEQKVIDVTKEFFSNDPDKDKLLSVEEAREYAKEKGVDWNSKDKSQISKYKLDVLINKELLRRQLADEIMQYQQDRDYTRLERLGQLWSTISGSVGAAEVASYIGMTALCGAGIEAMATNLASKTGTLKGLYDGIKMAQKGVLYQKKINTYKTVAKEALYAKRIGTMEKYIESSQKAIKEGSFLEKVGYDTARFYKMGGPGGAASLSSTMVPFALDSAISDIPRELGELAYSNTFETEEYGAKEILRDQLVAVGLGAGLPVAGKGLKVAKEGLSKGTGAAWEVTEEALNKVKTKVDNKKYDELLKNRIKNVEALEEEGKNIDSQVLKIREALQEKYTLPENIQAEIIQDAENLFNSNYTNDEIIDLLVNKIDTYTVENVNNSVNSRTAFMSTKPKVLNTLQLAEAQGKTIDEAWEDLQKAGIKIKRPKSKVNESFNLDLNSELDEVFNRMKNTWYDAKGKVAGETGYLGSKDISALTHNDVDYLLKNLYIANMLPTSNLGKQAAQNLLNYRNMIEDLSFRMKRLVEEYNNITDINKVKDRNAAKNLLRDRGFSEDQIKYLHKEHTSALPYEAQSSLYTLKDGTYGSINTALFEIVEDMLPRHIKEQLNKVKDIINKANLENSMTGHSETLEVKQAREFLQNINDEIRNITEGEKSIFIKEIEKEYENNPGVKHHFINLIPFEYGKSAETGEAKATRSARIEYISNLLDEINANNADLFNAELKFQEQLPSPDEITAGTKTIQDVSKAEEMMAGYSDHLTFEKSMKTNEPNYNRFTTTSLELNNRLQTEEGKVAETTLSSFIKDNLKQTDNKKALYHASLITDLFKNITALDEILKADLSQIIPMLQEKMKTNTVFMELQANPKITSKSLFKVAKAKSEFKKLVYEIFDETLNADKKITRNLNEGKVKNILNSAADKLEDYLTTNKTEGVKNLITPHGYNAELNTKEEIAGELLAQAQRDKLFTEILTPFVDELTKVLMDEQTVNYETYMKLLDLTDIFASDPAHMDEALLGIFTMTPVEGKAFSLSIENISNPAEEWSALAIALDKNDQAAITDGVIPKVIAQNKEFEPLTKWALKPENYPEISKAIFDRLRYAKGLMTKEEEAIYTKGSNTRAARTAQCYLDIAAKLNTDLFNVGSNIKNIVQLIDSTKLREIPSKLQRDMYKGSFYNNLTRMIAFSNVNNDYKYISKYLNPLITPLKNKKNFLGDTNAILHFFEVLDLNKQFKSSRDLNKVRDALLEVGGIERAILSKELTHKEIEKCLKEIKDGFLGIEGESVGFLHKIKGDLPLTKDVEHMSFKAKYLEDMEQKLFYKNPDVELEDLKTIGYDNLKSLFDSNIGGAKKAYATLKKVGPEPLAFKNAAIELARWYAKKVVPKTHGYENASKLSKKLGNTWEKAVTFNVHNVCGTYTIPANAFMRWTQSFLRILTSPMLAKAGFKSITDYNYQMQYLINMGLAGEGDLQARWRVGSQLGRRFTQDKYLAEQIHLTNTVRADVLYSFLYNTPLGTGEMAQKGFNKYASNLAKFEEGSRKYTDFLLNKFFWIGPLTDYNRTNAALTTMKAIGAFSNVSYKQMPTRLQDTLLRFGVSEYEWDNIFSKHLVTNVKDYIKQTTGVVDESNITNYKMFFPQLVDNISDDTLKTFMKDQKLSITEMSIQKYKRNLKDKVSVLINSSADEMTSIPTSRIQGALGLHSLPNSGTNFALNSILQFQSFGAAINYYQWARRLAAHTTQDTAFNHLLFEFVGHPSSTVSIVQFVAESALVEAFVGELVKEVSGTNRKLVNDKGEFQSDAAIDKSLEYIGGSAGLINILLQTLFSGLTQAKGQGGGLSIPALPSLSTVLQKGERIGAAFTKESVKNQRGKAIAGALLENVADMSGLVNQPLVKATWSLLIGDTLREWQYGDRAKAIMTQRAHRGYAPSWVRHKAEEWGIVGSNDTTIYSKYFE